MAQCCTAAVARGEAQAGYRRSDLGGRIRGSHPIYGGGDRVRLSRELERDAIKAGLISSWQHTNAKRAARRKERRLQRLYPKKALPTAVAGEIEFRRTQIGLSQHQLASLVGRSQARSGATIRSLDQWSIG